MSIIVLVLSQSNSPVKDDKSVRLSPLVGSAIAPPFLGIVSCKSSVYLQGFSFLTVCVSIVFGVVHHYYLVLIWLEVEIVINRRCP